MAACRSMRARCSSPRDSMALLTRVVAARRAGPNSRASVDPHLESLGLEGVEKLEVARRRIDEILEDAPDDRPATLVREKQHFEHAVAGRICELFLHELQRRSGTENARELGKAREGLS